MDKNTWMAISDIGMMIIFAIAIALTLAMTIETHTVFCILTLILLIFAWFCFLYSKVRLPRDDSKRDEEQNIEVE